jgi:hypothetical protein
MHAQESIDVTIRNVAKLFYQLKIDEGIKQLAGVADLLNTTLSQLQASEEDIQHIQSILSECMTAYQHKEYILLADLIQYELAPIFTT